ncbi:MAG: UDP-N-acetyl-D-mannosamine dehydrogenase [Spirochaetes bacterium]|nr:UDP-N-acetyl-D-mannosamine dehydrogenase [Spirochaetota bacterium]
MKVVIMGLGYIGLPTAALIASKNIEVHGVDINNGIIEIINKGKIHITEPDLEGLVSYVVSNKYLKAYTEPAKADVFIIAVPTPFKNDNQPDISYIESAAKMLIPYLEKENLVILESTSPVGTTEILADIFYQARPELKENLYISYCPERVLPGKVIYELEHNDRVIGGINEKSTQKAYDFYSLFVKGELHKSEAKTAEMCKLVENSYRDVNIAFANELSLICDKAGIDVYKLINLANRHPRVKILKPGVGVGGHCIAVDPWFIVHDYKEESKIIRCARDVNNYKTQWVINKIKEEITLFIDKNGRKPSVACLGLTFKADIDDMRESPALNVTKTLIKEGHDVLPVEPNIRNHKDIKIYDYNEAVDKADIIVLLVGHKEFKKIDLNVNKIVFDFVGF